MRIGSRILLYFSTTVITLTIASSVITYILFAEHRREEFQQRQKVKIQYTIGLIAEYKELSENLSAIMDKHTIHDFLDEKMLIFDSKKQLIFKSIDDLPIFGYQDLLNNLSVSQPLIETREAEYDVIAMYVANATDQYYAISKARDTYGYSKLSYLRNVLIAITAVISIVVLIITAYLSKKISQPITALAEQLNKMNFEYATIPDLNIQTNSYELNYLIERFNHLVRRTNEAFSFQKHSIHHISHQLKTPIAVLVSELERITRTVQSNELRTELEAQIVKTESLGNIINTLLELSKIEAGSHLQFQTLRIDEIIYDIISELIVVHPDFHFDVIYKPKEFDHRHLAVEANAVLLKQALLNVLSNCISYSSDAKGTIEFDCSDHSHLSVIVSNNGSTITEDEEKFLFNHFFRGKNSANKTGFGLGLVLSKTILTMHSATITYSNPQPHVNTFRIQIPLR